MTFIPARHLKEIEKCSTEAYDRLKDQEVDNEDLEAIVASLNKNPNITKLDLSTNNLEDEEAAQILCRLKYVKELNVARNNLGNAAVILAKDPQFIWLNVSQNAIDERGGEEIAAANISDKTLILNQNRISEKTQQAIKEKSKNKSKEKDKNEDGKSPEIVENTEHSHNVFSSFANRFMK